MFTADQFRAKAAEYSAKIDHTAIPSEIRELRRLEQSFLWLAQNEDWLANSLDTIIRSQDAQADKRAGEKVNGRTAPEVEEHILRCLGAAVILQWATIPAKLKRELFDTAGSLGELLQTSELRGQIARFLHQHSKDESSAAASFLPKTAAP
jgi:hypothetical protein